MVSGLLCSKLVRLLITQSRASLQILDNETWESKLFREPRLSVGPECGGALLRA